MVAIQYSSWINKHSIAVTIQQPTQVTSCCNLLAPVRQLSSDSRSTRMSVYKCNECSLSNTTWHLVLTQLARLNLGIHFQIFLCQTNRQYLVWSAVSVTQEACRTETIPVDLRC
jgi:hypothetical protein